MKSPRILTVCVGISAYRAAVLDAGEKPLQFLADSARDLSNLFRAAWPEDRSRHLLAVDGEATLAGVRSLIAAEQDDYDFLVLYLGGHGRGGERPFQFLFFGNNAAEAAAFAHDIDGLVALPGTRQVLLLLDACHAGKYAEVSEFFHTVAPRGSRLCLASSLPDQKSWEDPRFKRSLFADAVVRALTERPGGTPRSRRVAGEFFEEVAADVAQHAFGLKGSAAQEPLIAGVAAIPISLPTAASRHLDMRSMTTYEVLLLRTRQIGVAFLCVAMLTIGTLSIASWRPAMNGSGLVEIRPGPKWLSPLNIGPWQRRIETDISVVDLRDEQDDPDARTELRDERGIHPWPGLNQARVRRWADTFIDDYLGAEAAARWRVRLGYADAVERLVPIGRAILPTRTAPLVAATTLAAEVMALNPHALAADVWQVQWRNNFAPGGCDAASVPAESADQLSMYLHLTKPTEFSEWLRGLALAARVDDAVGLHQVTELAKMLTAANAAWRTEYTTTLAAPGEPITGARIAARFTERPSPAEVAAVADVAAAIVDRRVATGLQPVTPVELAELLGLMDGCADVAARALAKLGAHGNPDRVIAWAHSRVRADQGRLPLRDLAVQGMLPDAEILWVLKTLGFSGEPADRKRAFVDAREWLSAIADGGSLPADVISSLVRYATERAAASDRDGAREAFLLVARIPLAWSLPNAGELGALLSEFGPLPVPLSASSPVVEELGLIARSGAQLSLQQRAVLMATLEGSRPDDPSRITFTDNDRSGGSGPTQLVTGMTSTRLIAFSRLVIGAGEADPIARDPRTLPFLEQAVADGIRFGVRTDALRETVTAAVVAFRRSGGIADADLVRAAIRRHSDDAAKRQAAIQIWGARLRSLPLEQREHVLDGLRRAWAKEQEPETKLALAATIIGTLSEFERSRRLIR